MYAAFAGTPEFFNSKFYFFPRAVFVSVRAASHLSQVLRNYPRRGCFQQDPCRRTHAQPTALTTASRCPVTSKARSGKSRTAKPSIPLFIFLPCSGSRYIFNSKSTFQFRMFLRSLGYINHQQAAAQSYDINFMTHVIWTMSYPAVYYGPV